MTTRRELQTRVNTLAAHFSDVKEELDKRCETTIPAQLSLRFSGMSEEWVEHWRQTCRQP